ncbi:MAG: response regulator, partial [bacterium]|nr:response regulator [bacterium]
MSEKKKPIRILLVDDDDIDRQAALRYIKKEKLPYRVKTASSEEEALKALKKNHFDVALLDYDLRTATGLDILPFTGDIPAIFVTGSGNEEVAVEAMRMGASDYLIKDPERNYLTVLPITIHNVLEQKRSRDQKEKLEAHIHQVQKYDSLNTLAGSIA